MIICSANRRYGMCALAGMSCGGCVVDGSYQGCGMILVSLRKMSRECSVRWGKTVTRWDCSKVSLERQRLTVDVEMELEEEYRFGRHSWAVKVLVDMRT